MRRLVLVAVPEDAGDPPGTYARVIPAAPRRYAVVDDRVAFTIWVAANWPDGLVSSGDGVAVKRDVERSILRRCADDVEAVPGVLLKTDGRVRIVGTPPDGSLLESWVSPLDIEVESGELADRVERVQSGRYRRG